MVKQSDPKRYELEPNHSHFLIFDGESTDLDTLLLQRAKIEEYSCQIDIKNSRKDDRIPAVMILLEDGFFSIRTVCQSNLPFIDIHFDVSCLSLLAMCHPADCRFEKARSNRCPWVEEIKWSLCKVLFERKDLVVIFEFDTSSKTRFAFKKKMICSKYFTSNRLKHVMIEHR